MYTHWIFRCGCIRACPPNFAAAEPSQDDPRAHPRHVRELIDARIRVRRNTTRKQGCERARMCGATMTRTTTGPDVCQGERYIEVPLENARISRLRACTQCPAYTLQQFQCNTFVKYSSRNMEPMMFTDSYDLTVEIFNTSLIKITIKILRTRTKNSLDFERTIFTIRLYFKYFKKLNIKNARH